MLIKPLARRGGVATTLLALPFFSGRKQTTIENALSRLKKKHYIAYEGRFLIASEKGKRYLKHRTVLFPTFLSPFEKNAKKSLIVMFDIPETRKSEREWFRRQLRDFGYEMIQKSVWFGPSPLPKEFVDYVKSIGLRNAVKTFKVYSFGNSF